MGKYKTKVYQSDLTLLRNHSWWYNPLKKLGRLGCVRVSNKINPYLIQLRNGVLPKTINVWEDLIIGCLPHSTSVLPPHNQGGVLSPSYLQSHYSSYRYFRLYSHSTCPTTEVI